MGLFRNFNIFKSHLERAKTTRGFLGSADVPPADFDVPSKIFPNGVVPSHSDFAFGIGDFMISRLGFTWIHLDLLGFVWGVEHCAADFYGLF